MTVKKPRKKTWAFVSFASLLTKRNIGVCVVQVTDINDAYLKCKDLGLLPNDGQDVDTKVFEMNEEQFEEQGLEPNHLYSREEMLQRGFAFN